MFAWLFVSVETHDVFDLRFTRTQPTTLGRQFGWQTRWTVHQFNGLYGGWKVNGEYSGSELIAIDNTIEIVATDPDTEIKIVVAPSWHEDISMRVYSPCYDHYGQTVHLPARLKPKLKVAKAV
jgi:hypothetical protein